MKLNNVSFIKLICLPVLVVALVVTDVDDVAVVPEVVVVPVVEVDGVVVVPKVLYVCQLKTNCQRR